MSGMLHATLAILHAGASAAAPSARHEQGLPVDEARSANHLDDHLKSKGAGKDNVCIVGRLIQGGSIRHRGTIHGKEDRACSNHQEDEHLKPKGGHDSNTYPPDGIVRGKDEH